MNRSALLVTILLSLACGVAANLGTPLIKTLYFKGIFRTQKARINAIKAEIGLAEHYLNNPTILNLFLFKELFVAILMISLATVFLLAGDVVRGEANGSSRLVP